MSRMKNIVLIGMPGSGKTTIGELIRNKVNMNLCNIDRYIETSQATTISEIFKSGEDHFRDIETKAVEVISEKKGLIIDTGGGVIKRKINIELLRKNGIIIFINRPLDKIISDIDVSNRPLLKDGKERLHKLYEERFHMYRESCDYELLNDSSLDDIVRKILNIIEAVA